MENRIPIFHSLAMIEENIQNKLTVEILADSVHFSKYHYQRMFREAVGDSVMAYVNRRRLALAAEELAKTSSTILEIALKYGYDSHEGFTRSFKSYMGATPSDYRKYGLALSFLQMETGKEKSVMMYSKAAQEIIRELNSLIVQARDTAGYTRREGTKSEAGVFYSQFWNYIAHRAQVMADMLEKTLEEITVIQHRPDEISARFRIIKAIETAAFEASITAFQAGLMIARAKPEQRKQYAALQDRYDSLARNARLKTEKIADFLNELAVLIFKDMRMNAEQRIQEAVRAGRAAAEQLSDPKLPYAYIREAAEEIAEELSAYPLEKISCRLLDDYLARLDIIVLAGDMDMFRAPVHETLFHNLSEFREKIREAGEFFGNFPQEWARSIGEAEEADQGGSQEPQAEYELNRKRRPCDVIFQEKILLFYLKGEIQKLRFARADIKGMADI